MLVISRKQGEWFELVEETTGKTIRVRVYNFKGGRKPRCDLAFDDPQRHFKINRLYLSPEVQV